MRASGAGHVGFGFRCRGPTSSTPWGAVVLVLVASTLVGLALLWPHGSLGRKGQFGPIHTVGAVTVVGASAVMLVMMPLSYGIGAKAMAAWLGTAMSLLLATGLAYAFAHIAHLSGAASDESVYLGASQSRLFPCS